MAVKIKLMRLGKIRNPQYRIVVADSRTKRDGRAIEEIGKYHPKEDPSLIEVQSERVQYWLGVGAQPTEAVAAILKVTGDWQKFKGLPGAEGTLRVAAPKVDRVAVFAAAAAEAANLAPAPKPVKKAAPAAAPVAEAAAPVTEAAAPAPEVVEAPAEAVAPAPEIAETAVEAPAPDTESDPAVDAEPGADA